MSDQASITTQAASARNVAAYLSGTQEAAHDAHVRGTMLETHTALPGVIDSFNPATQTASVQATIQRVLASGPVALPLCVDVPVFFPRAGGLAITFPIAKGDECLLVFAERSIDSWFQSGGVQPPADARMHDLSDAFAIVGFCSQPRVLTNVSTSSIQIRSDAGNVLVNVDASSVSLGAAAGSHTAARGDNIVTYLTALIGALQTFTAAMGTDVALAAAGGGVSTTAAATLNTTLGTLPPTNQIPSPTVKLA